MITSQQLNAMKIDQKWLDPLNVVFDKYQINTELRMAAFLGQCMHESDNFTLLQENLNYSAERLCQVWPARFPTIESAKPYANNPSKLADKVYGGRMGNGTEESGEGSLYKGRGIIQLTGKEAYIACGNALQIDLANNPNMLLEPKYACLSAGWFWNKRDLNTPADKKDYELITKRINGGLNGLADRIKNTEKVLEAFNPKPLSKITQFFKK